MSIRIRPAGPLDLDLLEAIENDADRLLIERLQPTRWEPAPTATSRAMEHGFVLVAEVDTNGLAGFAHVVQGDRAAHLEQLSVSPEYGRHGYGRLLLQAAKDEARRRGFLRMTLRTYADVPWNAPFYARVGFVEERPTTPFEKSLIEIETRLGLDSYGRRIQMAAALG